MQVTLKMCEKMDHLLDEAEELTTCAMRCDDADLKAVYLDLARCHFDGYEKLARIAGSITERKAQNVGGEKGQVMREMVDWHKDKYRKRAEEIKKKMEEAR